MITLIDGFAPDVSDQFTFFTDFSSITGRFGSSSRDADRIYFKAGSFAMEYASTALILSDFQAMPEPTTIFLVTCSALWGSLGDARVFELNPTKTFKPLKYFTLTK